MQATEGSQTEPSPTITAAAVATGATTPVSRVIEDQGFDEAQSVDLQNNYMEVDSAINAILNKQADIGYPSQIVSARLNSEGSEIRLFGALLESHLGCVVNSSTGVESVGDLRDVTLGSLPQSSSTYQVFRMIVDMEGYDIDEFDVRVGSPGSMFGLTQQGELDGLLLFDPFLTRLIATGDFHEVFSYSDKWQEHTGHRIPHVENGTYQSVIDGKPEALTGYVEAFYDAGEYIEANLAEVIDQYGDVIGVSTSQQKELFAERIEGKYQTEFDEGLREGSTSFVTKAVELGMLESEPNVNELFVHPDEI